MLQYGDDTGAVGFLIGKENQGLQMIFAMMNHARFGVGAQGVAIGARALAQARAYAHQRVQGIPMGGNAGDPIAHHPDVQRLLGTMAAQVAANRALMIYTAAMLDQSVQDEQHKPLAELLIPIFKAYATERAIDIASAGIQIHGGMGYIEETGAAQHLRDARILPIYEGTTAIQANDLLFRKTIRDDGATVLALIAKIADDAPTNSLLASAATTARAAVLAILAHHKDNPRHAAGVSVPYLMMLGSLTAGWLLDQSAHNGANLPGGSGYSAEFIRDIQSLNQLFATHSLPDVSKYAQIIIHGASAVEATTP